MTAAMKRDESHRNDFKQLKADKCETETQYKMPSHLEFPREESSMANLVARSFSSK